jgi:hypothetical protein
MQVVVAKPMSAAGVLLMCNVQCLLVLHGLYNIAV